MNKVILFAGIAVISGTSTMISFLRDGAWFPALVIMLPLTLTGLYLLIAATYKRRTWAREDRQR